MKSIIFMLVIIMLSAFLVASCEKGEKAEPQMETAEETQEVQGFTTDMLTTPMDLACGMTLTNETIHDTAIYKGQLYGFCSEDCKMKFKQDPETFVLKLEKTGEEQQQ
ncbi:MAG: hypothetical protein Kow0042_08290 [Calditrichia bacterium]